MSFLRMDGKIALAVVVLGFSSIVVQTIVLREFLAVFAGNELVIGILFANWMVLTGAGAFVGRFTARIKSNFKVLTVLLVVAALLPLVTVFFLRALRNLVFPIGSVIGIVESFYGSFILLIPYCLVAGFLFTLLTQIVSEGGDSIAAVYSLESAGSVIGGTVFNILIVTFLSTFQALILLGLLNLAVCIVFASTYARVGVSPTIALVVLLITSALAFNLDNITRGYMFGDQFLLLHRDTPYGNITVTRQGEQTNVFENSALLFSSNDVPTNEEAVHYAMVQHPEPKAVLIISGDIAVLAGEVFKYGVTQVDFVEVNPWLIEVQKRFASASIDQRVHFINEDARRYLRHASANYDVVLLNVPDPGTAQINRYYTVEFFRELRSHLATDGVLSLGLLSSADYFGSDARLVSSSLYNTLRSAFQTVLIVPGNRNYFVASDRELSIHIARMVEKRGIATTYVNKYYVDDQLLQQRSDDMLHSLDMQEKINRDFSPIAYYRQVHYWLSYFSFSPWVPAIIVGMLVLALLFRLNPISVGMLTGGFAASSTEFLLLISFQILYGYVYQATGIIITVFMAGLAIGAWFGQRRIPTPTVRGYAGLQSAVAAYCFFLPVILLLLKDIGADGITYVVLAFLTMSVAAMVGMEFCMATKLLRGNVTSVASELYSVDLIGSAIGVLIVSAYLLPMLGLVTASVLVGSMNLLSATIALVSGNKFVRQQNEGASYV